MAEPVARDLLRSFVERIERLEAERHSLGDDVKSVYAEAKDQGFKVKILRKLIVLRRKDAAQRREDEEILELYMGALGMLSDTPLGRAAVEREFGVSAHA